ncbi:MAG: putative DNA-binding domain-containing protein [Ramlibacter sp.]
MSLPVLQAWMQQAIREPGQPDLQALAPQHLQSSDGLGAEARLAIYQRSYRARLLQGFQAIFPGLLHATGADMLNAFAVDFLTQHPPHSHSVNRVADGFAAHLAATRPPREGNAPDWADFLLALAELESTLLQVSEEPGLERAATTDDDDASAVRGMADADLLAWCPRAAPCLRLLRLSHPVHDYLQALRRHTADSRLHAAPDIPPARPVWLALSRARYRLHTRELAHVQWELLRRLDGQTPVSRLLPAVAALGLRPVPDLGLLRLWLGNFEVQGFVGGHGPRAPGPAERSGPDQRGHRDVGPVDVQEVQDHGLRVLQLQKG